MKKIVVLAILAAFLVGAITVMGCGPGKDTKHYYAASQYYNKCGDTYKKAKADNDRFKNDFDAAKQRLATFKAHHEDLHKQRNDWETKKHIAITPLLHGQTEPNIGFEY
jgi:hypothetical protein